MDLVGPPDPYIVPPDVAWVDGAALDEEADRLYLSRVPSGNTIMLEGSARLIWLAVTDGDRTDTVASVIAADAGLDSRDVREDVAVFLSDLVSRRYLHRSP